MNNPYWSYETSMGYNLCVSIRANKNVAHCEYYKFLGEFIVKYSHRITEIRETTELVDNSMVCIIKLIGNDGITFMNQS